eukprot:10199771-Ditylum_brightwellii.AAC.1
MADEMAPMRVGWKAFCSETNWVPCLAMWTESMTGPLMAVQTVGRTKMVRSRAYLMARLPLRDQSWGWCLEPMMAVRRGRTGSGQPQPGAP